MGTKGWMMQISIKDNLKDLSRKLTNLQREQIPFATARALSDTAFNTVQVLKDRVVRDMEKPKPFTVNAFLFKKATKRKQYSLVYIKPTQADYMGWIIEGGTKRGVKEVGGIPYRYRHRRMTANAYRKLVASDSTFRGTINGIDGLWQRVGRDNLKLIVVYESQARYEPNSFKYYQYASETIAKRFPVHWNNNMIRALKTAR